MQTKNTLLLKLLYIKVELNMYNRIKHLMETWFQNLIYIDYFQANLPPYS